MGHTTGGFFESRSRIDAPGCGSDSVVDEHSKVQIYKDSINLAQSLSLTDHERKFGHFA